MEIFQVVDRVCDVVGPIHQLGLKRFLLVRVECSGELEVIPLSFVGRPLTCFLAGFSSVPRIFQASSERGAREIYPGMVGEAYRQLRYDAKGLGVPLEAFLLASLFDESV